MTDTPAKLPKPSLLRHLISMVYDALLVIALIFVVNGLALGVTVQLSYGEQEVLNPYIGQALIVICLVGFYSAFWLKSGQTLGMQAWRIKLVSIEGQAPTFTQALLRCLGAVLSAGCFGLGYLWKLFDRNHRYWHDYLSGTELILLPKSSRDSKT
ncbi:MAG: RDD family protein [Halioglobus sp.]